MKKLLVFALCTAVAGFASAGSIQWNMNLGRSGFVADSKGNALSGDIYLILTSSATALEEAAANNTFETVLSDVKLDSMTLTDGKNANVVTTTKPSTTLKPDQTYSFSLVVFDAANKQFYVSSALSEVAYDEGADVVTPTKVTFTGSMVGNTFATPTNGKWTSVPEPSTAMLALAGLALLIKRRRA